MTKSIFLKLPLIMALGFLMSSCGALKISPRSCTTNSIWGTEVVKVLSLDDKPIYFSDLSEGDNPSEDMRELKAKETYFVIANVSLRLKDLLEEHQINCEDVKKLSLKIETKFFFWREVSLKVSL